MSYKFGIIGAMEVEVQTLKEHMTINRTVEKASMTFCEGTMDGTACVVVQCGIGKVNAGMCVQILADMFDVTHIINTGVAGSLDNDINIGDIVVSTDAVQHDYDVTPLGYKKGQIPGIDVHTFAADEWLRGQIKEAVKAAAPDIQVFDGRVCSGDQFIADDGVKSSIIETFNGKCAEMEGAAIAQACYLNKIPFAVVRAISDKANGSGHIDYPTFEKKAAKDCAATVEYMIAHVE